MRAIFGSLVFRLSNKPAKRTHFEEITITNIHITILNARNVMQDKTIELIVVIRILEF